MGNVFIYWTLQSFCLLTCVICGAIISKSKYNYWKTAFPLVIVYSLVEGLRCIYFKDIKINTCPMDEILTHDKENGFEPSKYNNLIDQLFVIIEKLSLNFKNISSLYLENILPDIQHWSAIMENNVNHYRFFDSVNEFKQYNYHIMVSNEDFDFYSFDFYKKN